MLAYDADLGRSGWCTQVTNTNRRRRFSGEPVRPCNGMFKPIAPVSWSLCGPLSVNTDRPVDWINPSIVGTATHAVICGNLSSHRGDYPCGASIDSGVSVLDVSGTEVERGGDCTGRATRNHAAGPAVLLTPSLNLIERPWKFTQRRAFYASQRPILTNFRAAIEQPLSAILTQYASDLAGPCQDPRYTPRVRFSLKCVSFGRAEYNHNGFEWDAPSGAETIHDPAAS